jgi:hypothetical protein
VCSFTGGKSPGTNVGVFSIGLSLGLVLNVVRSICTGCVEHPVLVLVAGVLRGPSFPPGTNAPISAGCKNTQY